MLAIVPAHNEAVSVASVVAALLPVMGNVVVVDDGSTDDTAALAHAAGAIVIQTPQNLGKGQAMRYALSLLPEDEDVAFFDADLTGFRSEHAQRLLNAFAQGYDMVAGLRDRGSLSNTAQLAMPLITGERILKRWVIDAIPADCWAGYAIETAMNDAVRRGSGKTCLLYMQGVGIRSKVDKVGIIQGVKGHWRMFKQIVGAKKALGDSGGCSCASCGA